MNDNAPTVVIAGETVLEERHGGGDNFPKNTVQALVLPGMKIVDVAHDLGAVMR
jgi:hypothetical protein